MPFLSFSTPRPGWGVLIHEGIVPGWRLLDGTQATLRAVIEAGLLRQAMEEAAEQKPELTLEEVALLPPLPDPAHVFCAGLNYAAHAAETGRNAPAAPRMFLRAASSLIPHGAPLIRPRVSDRFDFEGELAVIIGQGGRHIAEADAMRHVAGYSCFMDGSIRDWQEHSVTTGKNFHGTGAFGPYLVASDEVDGVDALSLRTRVNGVEMQSTTTDRMIHTIPKLIAYLSAMTPLCPGDVIVTGTPEGIGCRRTPPVWLRPGDVVEVEISRIGILRNEVAQED